MDWHRQAARVRGELERLPNAAEALAAFDALCATFTSEVVGMRQLHRAWGYAKGHSALCAEGYSKDAFLHVQSWMRYVTPDARLASLIERAAALGNHPGEAFRNRLSLTVKIDNDIVLASQGGEQAERLQS